MFYGKLDSMQTNLVMGVELPQAITYDGLSPQLYYGARSRATGEFRLNGKTRSSSMFSNPGRMVLLDEPVRIHWNAGLIAIRESSFQLFEALGVPIDWNVWPVIGHLRSEKLLEAKGSAESAVPMVSKDETWLLIREAEEAYQKPIAVLPRNTRTIFRSTAAFQEDLQNPASHMMKSIVDDVNSSETLIRSIGEKPYLLRSPQFSAHKAGVKLRKRLWDEHGVWFDWFSMSNLFKAGTDDGFLQRSDVQSKLEDLRHKQQ